jgi:hypothetical protein
MIEISKKEAQCFYTLLASAICDADVTINALNEHKADTTYMIEEKEFLFSILEKLQQYMTN